MRVVLTCPDADYDAVTGVCSSPGVWIDQGSMFAGWTTGDFIDLGGALLTVMAVAYVFRLLHQWAMQQ